MKTSTIPVSAPNWYTVDAEGKTAGRLAADIAHVLRGKHKPTFAPHQLCGDHVVVLHASKMKFPFRKLLQKEYVRHSGYLGHIRSTRLDKMMEERPTEVIELAVKGMLPKNRLRDQMLKRLHVFTDDQHTYAAQKPAPLPTLRS